MAARRVRLDFFAKMTRRLKLDAIATGHHADDVAETFILRLARGSGPEGLAGLKRISHVNGITFIRPLLDLRSDDLRAFLRSRNMTWREDSTNSDTSILRNKVRHMVLPWLRKNLDPRITEHLCKSAAILRGDISLPSADAPSPCTPKAEAAPAKFSLKISPSAGFERRAQSFGSFPAMCEIARRAVAGRSIELRTWLPGDRIAPTGMNGHARKLQDIFVTAKVPPSLRATLPVLAYANSNEIIWVPGYRIAASAAVASPNDPSWRLTLDLDEPTVSSPSRKA
jgi:tRNA(Ile)-lysidine synthetase-like protein